MFDEGRRRRYAVRRRRVAAVRKRDAVAIIGRLENIPTSAAPSTAAVFRRRPAVCLIDELAFDNPPGSANPSRWQDVEAILNQGIAVITAINVQHIREQQTAVEAITGKRAARSIPQKFLREAEEIEVVDAPPDLTMATPASRQAPRTRASRRRRGGLSAREYLIRTACQWWGTQSASSSPTRAAVPRALNGGQRNARRFHSALLVAYVAQPG